MVLGVPRYCGRTEPISNFQFSVTKPPAPPELALVLLTFWVNFGLNI